LPRFIVYRTNNIRAAGRLLSVFALCFSLCCSLWYCLLTGSIRFLTLTIRFLSVGIRFLAVSSQLLALSTRLLTVRNGALTLSTRVVLSDHCPILLGQRILQGVSELLETFVDST